MQEFHALLELLAMLVLDPRTAVLIALLVVAGITDYRTYRIPNWLTFGGAAFALIYKTVIAASPGSACLMASGGLLLGFVIMLPPYVLGVMGAGDVKLMAMVGAFLGADETLEAVLFTFIAGGMAALAFGLFRGKLRRMLRNTKDVVHGMVLSAMVGVRPDVEVEAVRSVGKLPYGVCISVGTIAYVLGRQLGYA
ncbi:Flp pilus assembly protein, protease CpaA [Variovorax sp. PBL-H6]|uniref:A24 family peptidase n=1 Tax=Variovorax sp. PBL-H6 TaxID=434009 RepID=UPI0013177CFD|nr:A24 family peptidase [Variovorax sp. PBL-H6]VTU22005.1 Flp pilus assembly protein, protease CpaA [Variovorax sp. PBL-H6]